MVIIRTSAVEVSIHAVSPLLIAEAAAGAAAAAGAGVAAGGVCAMADIAHIDRIDAAPVMRCPTRYTDLMFTTPPMNEAFSL